MRWNGYINYLAIATFGSSRVNEKYKNRGLLSLSAGQTKFRGPCSDSTVESF